MTQRLALLLGLAAVLATVLGFDLFFPSNHKSRPSRPPQQSTGELLVFNPNESLNPVARLAPAAVAPLFDRPLFLSTRRAVDAAPSDAEANLDVTPPAPPTRPENAFAKPDLRLHGTVSLPLPGWAFLSGGEGEEIAFVSVGEVFLGWRLIDVGPYGVRFDGPEGALTLEMPDPHVSEGGDRK